MKLRLRILSLFAMLPLSNLNAARTIVAPAYPVRASFDFMSSSGAPTGGALSTCALAPGIKSGVRLNFVTTLTSLLTVTQSGTVTLNSGTTGTCCWGGLCRLRRSGLLRIQRGRWRGRVTSCFGRFGPVGFQSPP